MPGAVLPHQSAIPTGSPDDTACAMLELVEGERKKSIDRSTQTGAALVSPGGRILSLMRNGLPEGVADLPERHGRPMKYSFFEHAERRTLYDCAANGIATRGAAMYSSHFPCDDCARAIVECRVARLVVNAACMDIGLVTRFFDRMGNAADILNGAGVAVRMFHPGFHVASGAGRGLPAGPRPLGERDVWKAVGDSIDSFWSDKDPGDEALPARHALADAADFVRLYGCVQDAAATWESDGRVTALWRAGHASAVVRFRGDGRAEWAILADRIAFGAGCFGDCLSALAARPGLAPASGCPGDAVR
jgi:dCMP deaminase